MESGGGGGDSGRWSMVEGPGGSRVRGLSHNLTQGGLLYLMRRDIVREW